LAIAFLMSGCLYSHTVTPGQVNSETQFLLTSKDFEVIQRVEVTGEVTVYFGLVALGGEGYQTLLAKANEVGGDTIIDYSFDIEQKSILFFIYNNAKWKATGIAIKFKDHVRQGN